jgi:hypothetical protein
MTQRKIGCNYDNGILAPSCVISLLHDDLDVREQWLNRASVFWAATARLPRLQRQPVALQSHQTKMFALSSMRQLI